ncbi:hypothetical protein RFI_33720, partial [Reticulomyxa filosa]
MFGNVCTNSAKSDTLREARDCLKLVKEPDRNDKSKKEESDQYDKLKEENDLINFTNNIYNKFNYDYVPANVRKLFFTAPMIAPSSRSQLFTTEQLNFFSQVIACESTNYNSSNELLEIIDADLKKSRDQHKIQILVLFIENALRLAATKNEHLDATQIKYIKFAYQTYDEIFNKYHKNCDHKLWNVSWQLIQTISKFPSALDAAEVKNL